MAQPKTFGEVVDAVDQLSSDEQETLLAIIRRRLAERGREVLFDEIQHARREFQMGQCRPATVDDLMREIES